MSDEGPSFDELLAACADDPVSRAVTAAYALVTVYDYEVSDLEVDRWVELVGGDGDAFRALAQALKERMDATTVWAASVLSEVRGDPAAVERVVNAARLAVVADEALERREEVAVALVAEALGIDPSTL